MRIKYATIMFAIFAVFAASVMLSGSGWPLSLRFFMFARPSPDTMTTSPSSETYDYFQEQRRLQSMFLQRGTHATYAYFQGAYASINPFKIHSLAHWMGSELYQREGVNGISLCDDSFQFGCYHGFLGSLLSREGTGQLPKVEQACNQRAGDPSRFGGCVHGIGHGVLSLRGYQFANLLDGLKDCDRLSSRASAEGCYNGAFMEYNIRTMHGTGGEGQVIRTLDKKKPGEPCTDLPVLYQQPCFYEQPLWWKASGQTNDTTGTLCAGISNMENRSSCFRGLGRLLISDFDGDHVRIASFCNGLPAAQAASDCISEAFRLLLAQRQRDATELCGFLPEAARTACLQKSQKFLCVTFSQCANHISL